MSVDRRMRCVVLAALLMMGASECCGRLHAAAASKPVIVETRRIWDRARHNAFTDLLRFEGR